MRAASSLIAMLLVCLLAAADTSLRAAGCNKSCGKGGADSGSQTTRDSEDCSVYDPTCFVSECPCQDYSCGYPYPNNPYNDDCVAWVPCYPPACGA
jgi:hypothetical protein